MENIYRRVKENALHELQSFPYAINISKSTMNHSQYTFFVYLVNFNICVDESNTPTAGSKYSHLFGLENSM